MEEWRQPDVISNADLGVQFERVEFIQRITTLAQEGKLFWSDGKNVLPDEVLLGVKYKLIPINFDLVGGDGSCEYTLVEQK